MRLVRFVLSLSVGLAFTLAVSSVDAALPKETKEKISTIRKSLSEVAKYLRDDNLNEAKRILDESETELATVANEAGPDNANDRLLLSAQKYLLDQKARFHKEKGVSFVDDIAPIFNTKCFRCHVQGRSGGLSLASYSAMGQGGNSGPLLVPRSARRSNLMAKLTHPNDMQRMPRNGAKLSDDELVLISTWIDLGAGFDGEEREMELGDLIRASKTAMLEDVEIAMATGNEKVSFSRDIAPFMSRLCLGCHSGNNPRGGLSLETFERMMQGGDSGRVIIPGDREGSRLFRLVGGLENPRMPQGQARITRKNYEDLKMWFDEGNKYDGGNIKTPLRQLIPSQQEMKAQELAKLSPQEWEKMRIERSQNQWKRTLPQDAGERVEGDEFLVWGNVPKARLADVEKLANRNFVQLKSMFEDENKDRTFSGRLTIFLFKDRIGYEEFLFTIEQQQPDRSLIGHSKVTPSLEDAYIALEDVGDQPDAGEMSLEISLVTQLTNAYLQKMGEDLPGWVTKGTGLYLASQSGGADYFRSLPKVASDALSTVRRPDQIFAEGAFDPSQEAAVGYTLVSFLIKNGGARKFGQFISRIRSGTSVTAALQAVYRSNAQALAQTYARSLPR